MERTNHKITLKINYRDYLYIKKFTNIKYFFQSVLDLKLDPLKRNMPYGISKKLSNKLDSKFVTTLINQTQDTYKESFFMVNSMDKLSIKTMEHLFKLIMNTKVNVSFNCSKYKHLKDDSLLLKFDRALSLVNNESYESPKLTLIYGGKSC